MNIIDLKAVGKVILNELTPDRSPRIEHYLIPYYQRGYRWDVENVTALLEDVYNFMLSEEKKYCLQPIVVVPRIDEEGYGTWEVIDGQQRLTTLYIIFKFLGKPKYEIIFEKRGHSTEFLRNLAKDSYNHDSPDFHFMSEAYETVKQWFDKKTKNDIGFIDEFNSTLTKRVEIIWYQIEELKGISDENIKESKKIDIFNRLNIGKIPLTDAELIRALLLSKIKHGLSDREAILRQGEMAAEWHRIEQELRNKDFWYFVNQQPLEEVASTIEFLFKLIASYSSKKYSTYLWFEKEIKDDDPEIEKRKAEELWIKTKEYFGNLKYWYNNSFLYHHIGFKVLIENNPLKSIKECIDNFNSTKSEFKIWVENEVIGKFEGINLDELNYENNVGKIKQLLIWHNILSIGDFDGNSRNRFSFELYKEIDRENGWSIEHIHAQKSKPMKEENGIRKWLMDTYDSIYYLKDDEFNVAENQKKPIEKLINEMDEMIKSEKIDLDKFNDLRNKILEIFDSSSIHVLDNLALLSKVQNSSLNNSIFASKRIKIIDLDKSNCFVPPATKNIFLKYYSNSDLQPYYWSSEDKLGYFNDIQNKINPYLTPISNVTK